jgi:hypothetical protein
MGVKQTIQNKREKCSGKDTPLPIFDLSLLALLAAKGLQPSHQEHKSFGLGGTVAGGLENESTVDHPGNAVVKTLTLSLDAREPHGSEADCTEQKINV